MKCFGTWLLCLVLVGCNQEKQQARLTVEVDPAQVARASVSVKLVDDTSVIAALVGIGAHVDFSGSIPDEAGREFFENLPAGAQCAVAPGGKLDFNPPPLEPLLVASDAAHFWVLPVPAAAVDARLTLTAATQGGQVALKILMARPGFSDKLASRLLANAGESLAKDQFDAARHLAQNANYFNPAGKGHELLEAISHQQAERFLAAAEQARVKKDFASAREQGRRAAGLVPGCADLLLQRLLEDEGGELRALNGHKGTVTAVAFSPDGKLAVSGGEDRTIKLWDVATGKEVRTFTGHRGSVRAVKFAGNGNQLFSGSDDGTMRLWDVASGGEVMLFDDHGWKITSIDLSADGRYAVSGSEDHHVKLWTVADGKQVQSLSGHAWKVTGVAFTADPNMVVSASDDGDVKVWDVSSAAEPRTLRDGLRPVKTLVMSSDLRRIILGGDDRLVKVWDLTSGKLLTHLAGHTGAVTGVALSGDETAVLSGSADGSVRLWNLDSGKVLVQFQTEASSTVALGPTGRTALSAGTNGNITLWQLPRSVWPRDLEARR